MAHNKIVLEFRLSEAKKASAMIAAGSEHSQCRLVLSNSRLLILFVSATGDLFPKFPTS
jgi:hypothetical protein